MVTLGKLHSEGRGVSQDWPEAVKWFRRAAEEWGRPEAMFRLGTMYEMGYGVAKDVSEALKWYQKAADGGDSKGAECLKRLGK